MFAFKLYYNKPRLVDRNKHRRLHAKFQTFKFSFLHVLECGQLLFEPKIICTSFA